MVRVQISQNDQQGPRTRVVLQFHRVLYPLINFHRHVFDQIIIYDLQRPGDRQNLSPMRCGLMELRHLVKQPTHIARKLGTLIQQSIPYRRDTLRLYMFYQTSVNRFSTIKFNIINSTLDARALSQAQRYIPQKNPNYSKLPMISNLGNFPRNQQSLYRTARNKIWVCRKSPLGSLPIGQELSNEVRLEF